MKRIQLYTENDSWIACFSDDLGNPDKELAALFGTHHLPTAFRACAPFQTVQKAIQKLNPGYIVTLS